MTPSVAQDVFRAELHVQKKRTAQIRPYGLSASLYRRHPGELAVKKMSIAELERRYPSAPPPLTPDLTATQSASSGTPRSLSASLPHSSSLSLEPIVAAPPRDLSPRSRRQLRYHRAQTALSSSLQHSLAEPSLVDQQIRALERATAMLSAQAREAKEQAARLCECLADRANVEPTEFEAMLRERWLVDKREADMTDKLRVLEASLAALCETGQEADPAAGVEPSRMSPRKRAKANLALFLEHTGTRVPLASRLAPGQHVVAAAQRRKTMHRVRSLRLRQSACTFAFQLSMARPPARPLSPSDSLLDEPGTAPASSAPASPSLSPKTPPPATPSRGSLASPRSPRTPPKPSSRFIPLPPPTSSSPSSPWQDGFADILLPGSPRSRTDLLSQIEADDPGVPAYAVDLLDALVSSELDVSLRAPHTPMPHTPLHARHESESFGTAAARMLADGNLPPSPRRQASPSPSPSPGRDRTTSASSMPSWVSAAISRPRTSSSKSGAKAGLSTSSAQKIRRSLHLGSLGAASKSNPNMKAVAHPHGGSHSRLGSGSSLRTPLAQTSSSLSSVPESLASSSDDEDEAEGHARAGRAGSRTEGGLDLAESRSFSVVSFGAKGEEPQGVGGLVARVKNRLSGMGKR